MEESKWVKFIYDKYVEKQKQIYFYDIPNSLFNIFDLRAHFFGLLKIAGFVELEKLYRMVYKKKMEEVVIMKNQADTYSTYMIYVISVDNGGSLFGLAATKIVF